jgi:hypothetical protein
VFASFWNVVASDAKDGVGADDVLVALGQSANFFGIRFLPNVAFATAGEFWVFSDLAGVGIEGVTVEYIVL